MVEDEETLGAALGVRVRVKVRVRVRVSVSVRVCDPSIGNHPSSCSVDATGCGVRRRE